jgi:hypothetical protein
VRDLVTGDGSGQRHGVVGAFYRAAATGDEREITATEPKRPRTSTMAPFRPRVREPGVLRPGDRE